MRCVSTDNDFDPEESTAYKAILRKCLNNVITATDRWTRVWTLNGFGFDDTDAATIAKGLEGNTSVTELGLDHNHFTEAGLQAIAKMMENNSTITLMYLRRAFLSADVEHTHTHARNGVCGFAGQRLAQ